MFNRDQHGLFRDCHGNDHHQLDQLSAAFKTGLSADDLDRDHRHHLLQRIKSEISVAYFVTLTK